MAWCPEKGTSCGLWNGGRGKRNESCDCSSLWLVGINQASPRVVLMILISLAYPFHGTGKTPSILVDVNPHLVDINPHLVFLPPKGPAS